MFKKIIAIFLMLNRRKKNNFHKKENRHPYQIPKIIYNR